MRVREGAPLRKDIAREKRLVARARGGRDGRLSTELRWAFQHGRELLWH